MTETSFAAVDFEEVLGRLTLHALNLNAAMVCAGLKEKVLPGGDSAADLAQTTLLKFLDPQDTSVKWNEQKGQPTTPGVLAYLRKVLTRDFLDLKKSVRYQKTIYENPNEGATEGIGMTFDQMAGTLETAEDMVNKAQEIEWILKQFETQPELKEIAKLQLDPRGYNAFSNQELAKLLDTPVHEIENRKKRIKLILRKLAAPHMQEAKHVQAKD
jgi:DNA-directed RNA polymerase specialized sigma24 family protein